MAVLGMLFAGVSARAQGPERVAEAREHYTRGIDLFGQGAYEEACSELGRAYDLAPSYKILYDLGLCRERLGDYADALRELEKYMVLGGAQVPPPRQQEVSALVAELHQKVASITVTTNVPDAQLLLDETELEEASSQPLITNPGRHTIWATKAGYYPASRVLLVESADNVTVTLDLREMQREAPPRGSRLRQSMTWVGAVLAVLLAVLAARGLMRRRGYDRTAAPLRSVPRIDVFGSEAHVKAHSVPPTAEDARVIVCDPDAAGDPASTSPALTLRSDAQTDIGKVKPTNEDRWLIRRDIFVVADGIGGNAGGEVASTVAVHVLERSLTRRRIEIGALTHLPAPAAELASSVFAANGAIRAAAAADQNLIGMGTTCVAARFCKGARRLYIAHIGDSRAYRLRGECLEQLTTDHTMENMGVVGARGAHLAAALGVEPSPKIDMLLASPRVDDVYLLCSDGLTKMVSDAEVAGTLRSSRDAGDAARRLVHMANEAGGKDNVTAIVIRVAAKGAFGLG